MNSRHTLTSSLLSLSAAILAGHLATGRSAATTLYVSTRTTLSAGTGRPNSSPGDGASWATAFRTLSAAMDAAKPGDEIWVAAGHYPGNYKLKSGVRMYGGFHGNEARRFDRDWIQRDTFLSGRTDAPVVTIEGGWTQHRTVVDGFTIEGGRGFKQDGRILGGGVLVRGAVKALIAHNRIRNNTVRGTSSTRAAQVADGGGIGLMDGAEAVIKDNLILHNTASRSGGGIAVWEASDVTISNNTLTGNSAPNGGGMSFLVTNVKLLNNIVAFNSSGLYYPAAPGESGPSVEYHVIHGNEAYDYQGWDYKLEDVRTNVFKNPLFVDSGKGNFRLMRRTPCRNAGAEEPIEAGDEDYYRMARIRSGTVDIGASEASPIGITIRRREATGEYDEPEDPALDLKQVCVNTEDPKANDLNDGRSWDEPKKSINAGIDAAKLDGGEVLVAANSYMEHIFVPRGVRLRGGWVKANGKMVQASLTTVMGDVKVRPGLAMTSPDSAVENFRFVGGPAIACSEGPSTVRESRFENSPGAAVLGNGGSPVFANCTFRANMPALDLRGGAPEVHACRFYGNSGEDDAGAIVVNEGSALIADSVFAGNVGGAVTVREAMATVMNNTFYGNRGYAHYVSREGDVGVTAGAVDAVRAALTFVNNIVSNNTGGVQDRASLDGYPVVRNNCVFRNEGFDWKLQDLRDPTGSNGNMRADPEMVAPEYGRFQILLSSPCRNAGDTRVRAKGQFDAKGQHRIQGRAVDIGADENENHVYGRRYQIVRVKADGRDGNDGRTWATAVRTVESAISILGENQEPGGEIWVAAGQYRRPVVLPGFVALYGGFSGREDRRDKRDPEKNITELLGAGENPVVAIAHGAPMNVVDGFSIRGGVGTGYHPQASGGVVCNPGTTSFIANNILDGNSAQNGHALGADHAWVSLTGNTLTDNGLARTVNDMETQRPWSGAAAVFIHSLGVVADNVVEANRATGLCFVDRSGFDVRNNLVTANAGDAGGIQTWNSFNDIANNVITANNSRVNGGGLLLESSLDDVHDNLVSGNTTEGTGGGIHSLSGNPLVWNNTVIRNTAKDAGGAYLHHAAMLYNNIFAFNSSGVAADQILTGRDEPTLVMRFNCVYGNEGYEAKGLPQNGNLTGNFNEDPMFLRVSNDRPNEEFRLDRRSPCIDRGTDAFLEAAHRDIDGQPRLLGMAVDIGADERPDVPSQAGSTAFRSPYGAPSRPPISATGRRLPGGPAGAAGAAGAAAPGRPGSRSRMPGGLR